MIDPLLIDEKDTPLIVLVDDMRGFFSWVIKHHSHGNYSHVMLMIKPGYFATQSLLGFREVKVKAYMKNNIRLKFWQVIGLIGEERQKIIERVNKDLRAPWWKRRYDFLGILGQFIGFRWINNPWTRYCSERVRDYFQDILNIPIHPSPSEINAICKTNTRMKEFGIWEDN